MTITNTRNFTPALRSSETPAPQQPATSPEPQEPVEKFDWADAQRGAVQGALTYGLPSLAGALVPNGYGIIAGTVLGAGMGVWEARNSTPDSKIRSAMGGMLVGMAAARVAEHWPIAGTIGMTLAGAAAIGYYYGSN